MPLSTKASPYLSTMTTGIWTSCRGLFPSLRAWVRLRIWPRITLICFSNRWRSKPLSVWKKKRKEQNYIFGRKHNDFSAISEAAKKASYLEQIVKLIAQILYKVHFWQLGKNQIFNPLWEWEFCVWKPRPVVGIRPPGVGVFEREGQAIVDGSQFDVGKIDHAPVLQRNKRQKRL